MLDEPFELADVLAKLKRADESLAEFIAPLWPGVRLAAAWIEGRARLFRVTNTPAEEGYYLLGIDDDAATVLRPAEDEEARKYRGYLTKAGVILLEQHLAYPASAVERLQGITGARPIHFADGAPLAAVQARYDGLNLLFDGTKHAAENPLEDFFSASPIFTPGELLGAPGTEEAEGGAAEVLGRLQADPERAVEYRLTAVLETAGAVLEDWSRAGDKLRVLWRRLDEEHTVLLDHDGAPITSGISLAGARGFNPATLISLLHAHILDAWRA